MVSLSLSYRLGSQASSGSKSEPTMLFAQTSDGGEFVGYSAFPENEFGELRGPNPLPSNPLMALHKLPGGGDYAVFDGNAVTTLKSKELSVGGNSIRVIEADTLSYNAGTQRTQVLFTDDIFTLEPETEYPLSMAQLPTAELSVSVDGGGSVSVQIELTEVEPEVPVETVELAVAVQGGGDASASLTRSVSLAVAVQGGGEATAQVTRTVNLAVNVQGDGSASATVTTATPAGVLAVVGPTYSSNAQTIQTPANTQVGDVIVILMQSLGAQILTPAGFTAASGQNFTLGGGAEPNGEGVMSCYKVATAAGAETINIADTGAGTTVTLLHLRGYNTMFYRNSFYNAAAAASATFSGSASGTAGDLDVMVYGGRNAVTGITANYPDASQYEAPVMRASKFDNPSMAVATHKRKLTNSVAGHGFTFQGGTPIHRTMMHLTFRQV